MELRIDHIDVERINSILKHLEENKPGDAQNMCDLLNVDKVDATRLRDIILGYGAAVLSGSYG